MSIEHVASMTVISRQITELTFYGKNQNNSIELTIIKLKNVLDFFPKNVSNKITKNFTFRNNKYKKKLIETCAVCMA